MVTRRRGVKNTRRRRNLKTSIRKKTYRKKNIHINKKKISNKVTRKLGRLHHVGGAKGINDPMDDRTREEVESFLLESSLVPQGQSSQDMLDGIIKDVNEERREQGLAVVVRPTKLSLFGKLFEYFFGRKELHLDGNEYSDFVNTKGDEKYDVDVKFTQHPQVLEMYKNCFLSLKTKKLSNQKSGAFAGYVETGKAAVLLESLQDVLLKKHGIAKFKMVVESYYPVEVERKVVAIRGMHRHVYNITDNIGIILGRYNTEESIQNLLDRVNKFREQAQIILESKHHTLKKREQLLDHLKEKINVFNQEISRGRDGCLVRVDVKESKECRTFVHSSDPKVRTRIPQYRVASSLDIGRLVYDVVDPGSPIGTISPPRSESKEQVLPLQKGWSEALKREPLGRSGRSAEETERLLERFYSSPSQIVSARSAITSESTESRRPRSRSRSRARAENETSERARTPKSSGRKTFDELKEEKRRQREIENRQREIENQKREIENQKRFERLSNRQQAQIFAPSSPASQFPGSFPASSAASFAPSFPASSAASQFPV